MEDVDYRRIKTNSAIHFVSDVDGAQEEQEKPFVASFFTLGSACKIKAVAGEFDSPFLSSYFDTTFITEHEGRKLSVRYQSEMIIDEKMF